MAPMAASPEIDPALVWAAQHGDRMAQGELMDALIPFLGRLCGPIALQDGPDEVQEALIVIFRNLGQLARVKAARPLTIAVGGCLAQKDQGRLLERAPWVDVVFGTHNLAALPVLLHWVSSQ